MKKEFDGWNISKKKIEDSDKSVSFKEGEIWLCVFGVNLGVEIDGKTNFSRPAIILKKFNKDMALVVPTTTKYKSEHKYQVLIPNYHGSLYVCSISQIRAISTKRLIKRIGMLNQEDFYFLLDEVAAMISRVPQTTNSAYAELSKLSNTLCFDVSDTGSPLKG
jgi:mRNA-degrading endonuclease toxin of MazEF toxin-antitoxin module